MNIDHKYFNCSEQHEEDYVAGLYNETEDVRIYLREKCESGDIKYSTHDEVYKMLNEQGFTKKN